MATVRKCDMCGAEISKGERFRFGLKRFTRYELVIDEWPGDEWVYDLCQDCVDKIRGQMNGRPDKDEDE